MSYHIILVEDELDVRDFLLRALTRFQPHAAISTASNGAEALAVFQARGADLIISDHRMPVKSGLELLQDIRVVSQVPFVLISADATVERAAIAAGVSEFLAKPLSIAQLRAVVQRYLP